MVTEKIATIGENLLLRRMARSRATSVASYVHNPVAEGIGKIGVLVALTRAAATSIGRQVAMHVAATSPASLYDADLDPALVEREKAVLTEQARESRQARRRHREDDRRADEEVLRGGLTSSTSSSSSTPT